ncbi:DUF1661 domain-containing protein, partial [Porphyromonas gingivalis]|uniref:DUF1661 domain-containing protein n=1 Tax=Porphyromonas gingivalis TaxID=837 RepID=UPI003DA73F2D
NFFQYTSSGSGNPENTRVKNFVLAREQKKSRAKTKKFSRHVFTNADQVISRTKTQNNSCLFS